MIVTPVHLPLPTPLQRAPRTPGVHVSGLIRGIAVEAGILRPEWVEELSLVEVAASAGAWWDRLDETAKTRIAMGLAWEEWLIPLLDGVMDHPGEMCVQGVYMTHDGESLDVIYGKHQTRVHECKLTFKREQSDADMADQFMWLCQMKAYCRGLGTRFARIYVLFVCGDYSWPMRPRYRSWDFEFTQAEIDENWTLLMDYKDARLGLT